MPYCTPGWQRQACPEHGRMGACLPMASPTHGKTPGQAQVEVQMLYYTVFRTPWGYFALAGERDTVCRTILPSPTREDAVGALLTPFRSAGRAPRFEPDCFGPLQQRITRYFEGEPVDFRTDPPVSLDGISPFGRKVLRACRQIDYGRTATYGQLATRIGRPGAARAVGRVMARNPVPLLVPCHRVLRADGGLGGFSAPGGTIAKRRMLDHEQALGPTAWPRNQPIPHPRPKSHNSS